MHLFVKTVENLIPPYLKHDVTLLSLM